MLNLKYIVLFLLSILAINASSKKDIGKIITKADQIYNENPAQSYALYETAEREAISSENHSFDGEIHFGKARYLVLIAKYDAAMVELNKAILLFQENDNLESLASVYSVKSILLDRLGESQGAHEILLQALEIDKELKDTSGLLARYANLALDYYGFEQPDSLLFCLKEMESILNPAYSSSYYYYYQNWGLYFTLTNDFSRAKQQFYLALEVAESEKMTDSKATILMSLAEAHRKNGELKLAEKFALESYQFSEMNNLNYESSEALLELITIYEKQNNYAKAYEYQKKWVRLDKEINDAERQQKARIIESQLEIVEKEKEIALGEAALQAEKLESQTVRTRNAWLVAIVIIIIILLIFTAYIYSKTRKLNFEIQKQKEQIELKSLSLEDALMSIEDSLNYSQLIQASMHPDVDQLNSSFSDYFVLNKPKDIVSGDFYWIHNYNDGLIFAVGDCTGHGVPGAMVSMVCQEALNKVIKEKGVLDPALILDEVSIIIASTFDNSKQNLNDGMDIALCNISKSEIQFAGAHNPLWIIRHDEVPNSESFGTILNGVSIIILKGDNQAIGRNENPKPFKNQRIVVKPNDEIFLFSDGYVDQFGGEKGKKFKTSKLKELLCSLNGLDAADQKKQLDARFEEWKGALEQVDDVCIMGLKI